MNRFALENPRHISEHYIDDRDPPEARREEEKTLHLALVELSFVIPTRNQAQFLRQCIDGCLAQRIPDSEVLVVDGASTDNTREVLESYGDRVRWISEPDRGQSDAINKAIRLARGEMVAWINSDDYYAGPGVIARLLAELDRDPRCDVVYGDGIRVDVT